MPTNVTPEYKRAKEAYQRAREPAERLACLKEMLRTLPKHKGTEHVQADIKTRIKELTEELAGPRKGGARTGPAHTVRPEGAAQIALIGPPNTGKSSLHVRLTGSHAEVGPYPHTTLAPLPGMLAHEDIHFQLIDLPPVSVDAMESWYPNALQPARAALLVVDLTSAGCAENVVSIRERLKEKRIHLVDDWMGRLPPGLVDPAALPPITETLTTPALAADATGEAEEEFDDPFGIHLPTLLIANKCDLRCDPEEIMALEELIEATYPALFVSVTAAVGLEHIGELLFRGLRLVRVYTKTPGHPPDMERPYTVFEGETIHDIARLIHKDIAETFKFARVWGSGKFDGQQVGREHVLRDRDVVEIHTSG